MPPKPVISVNSEPIDPGEELLLEEGVLSTLTCSFPGKMTDAMMINKRCEHLDPAEQTTTGNIDVRGVFRHLDIVYNTTFIDFDVLRHFNYLFYQRYKRLRHLGGQI